MTEKTVDTFLQKFHGLDGITIGQKKKQLFLILKEHSPLKNDTEALQKISAKLHPQNFLEELFKLEVLIYFRRTSELYELLKEGNPIFVSKISKHRWFFQEIFAGIGANELINEALPCLSFSARMNVLKRLKNCLSEAHFDQVFQAVVDIYGISVASKFITGCSAEKVKSVFEEHLVKLTSGQLKTLFTKDCGLIEDYARENHKRTGKEPEAIRQKSLVDFMVKSNFQLFTELRIRYGSLVKLGKRATKRLTKIQKDDIINEPSKYTNNLRLAAVVRKFGGHSLEARTLFLNMLPSEYKYLQYQDVAPILKCYPKHLQSRLLIDSLSSKYGVNVSVQPEMFCGTLEKFLFEIPDNPYTAEVVRSKVNLGDLSYAKYLKPVEATKILKEAINICTEINKRRFLIYLMFRTCEINKDPEAFLEVLKYFMKRHRNEDDYVYAMVINEIEDHLLGYLKFKLCEEAWECLRELDAMNRLKFDKGIWDIFELSYIEAAIENKSPSDELLLEYLKGRVQKVGMWWSYVNKFPKSLLKHILTFAAENAAKIVTSETGLHEFHIELIDQFFYFNRDCSEEGDIPFLGIYPELLSALLKYVNSEDDVKNSVKNIVTSAIISSTATDLKTSLTKAYWEKFRTYGKPSHIMWFFRFEPLALAENSSVICSNIAMFGPNIFYIMKKFTHLSLYQECLNYSVENMGKLENRLTSKALVKCYSVLTTPANYMGFADSLKPTQRKLDIKDADSKGRYQLQCDIARYYKNTNTYTMLSSLLYYCIGDFFGSAIHSLNSLLYHAPEIEVVKILEELSTKAVSVRKHAFLYTCELCSLQTRITFLESFNQTEKDISLKNKLFTSCLNYFIHNPSSYFYDLVKRNMEYISVTDHESLESLTAFYQIPKSYQIDFLLHCWSFLHRKLSDNPELLSALQETFIEHLDDSEIILQLPLKFCSDIVEQHFFKTNEYREESWVVDNFVYKLLATREERIVVAETVVFPTVAKSLKQRKVLDFFNNLYRIIWKSSMPADFTILFVDFFASLPLFHPFKNFVHYLRLKVLKLKVGIGLGDCKAFGNEISALVSEIEREFGQSACTIFAKVLRDSINSFTTSTVDIYDLYIEILENHFSKCICLLVIFALPGRPVDNIQLKKYIVIQKLLREMSDPEVKINLNVELGTDNFENDSDKED